VHHDIEVGFYDMGFAAVDPLNHIGPDVYSKHSHTARGKRGRRRKPDIAQTNY
jgi:hypothetical protein